MDRERVEQEVRKVVYQEEWPATVEWQLLERCRPQRPVLIVGSGTRFLENAVRSAGHSVSSCPGPEIADCPLARNESCPLRDEAAACLVRTPPAATTPPNDLAPYFACLSAGTSPGIAVLAGRSDSLRIQGSLGSIGEEMGAEGVVAALDRVSRS